ncbi:hypothetical protein ACFQH6_09795 [Halobacteriaceae archaeon GCM10025711]
MDRRTVLRASLGAATALLGGCLTGGPGQGDETTTEEAGDGTTTTNERTTTTESAPSPTLVDSTFEITDAGCGTETSTATIERSASEKRVVVTGAVTGPNACYRAKLAGAEYDPTNDVLRVHVETVDTSGEHEVCAQCQTKIDYEATFSFDGGLPGEVEVQHDGDVVSGN